jgi:hypothetical protein
MFYVQASLTPHRTTQEREEQQGNPFIQTLNAA